MNRDREHWYEHPAVIVVGLIVVFAATVFITSRKTATTLDNGLWEFIVFAFGVGVSFYLGKQSVRRAAEEVVRPQARSALRRLVSLGRGIRSIQELATTQANGLSEADHVTPDNVATGLSMISWLLAAQFAVVVDAMEDWREFTPELVNELQEEGHQQP